MAEAHTMDQPRLMEAVFTVALLMGVSMPQPVIRNPDNRRATMITKFIGVAATMMLVVMPAIAGSTENNYRTVGYYLPDGAYVQTLHCWRHFVRYDVYGYALYRRVCAYR
jgi:hypothetical protein